MRAHLQLVTEAGLNDYVFQVSRAAGDTFVFTEERCRFRRGGTGEIPWIEYPPGQWETCLTDDDRPTARTIAALLRKLVVYQFHNTSENARVRNKWPRDDGRWLKEDGANLAAFLLRLREQEPRYYTRIVDTLRLILPFFDDFLLEPEYDYVLLRWRERWSTRGDEWFDASQAADGMLRTIALVALLLQPARDLPDVLILDEPELGLHPYAVTVVAGLLQAAALHVQVVVATQSVVLLDHFEPEDVVVVERSGAESRFERLDVTRLREWLDEYSLSELWEKNVLGGRPAR